MGSVVAAQPTALLFDGNGAFLQAIDDPYKDQVRGRRGGGVPGRLERADVIVENVDEIVVPPLDPARVAASPQSRRYFLSSRSASSPGIPADLFRRTALPPTRESHRSLAWAMHALAMVDREELPARTRMAREARDRDESVDGR